MIEEILNKAFSVDGFGGIAVKVTMWHKDPKSADTFIMGITMEGEAVKSETGFKSIQGFPIANFSKVDITDWVVGFIQSELHTRKLLQPQNDKALLDTESFELKPECIEFVDRLNGETAQKKTKSKNITVEEGQLTIDFS